MKTTRYTLRGIFKMKVLVQRVKKASVVIQDETVGEINKGFLLYVCFEANDTMEKLDKAVTKILNLRIFEDSKAKMNQNIIDVKGEILSVSQFTLSWDGKKGHRPSFDKSMSPNEAKIFYRTFNDKLSEKCSLKKGLFGAEMQVYSQNDGPVTFFLDFD